MVWALVLAAAVLAACGGTPPPTERTAPAAARAPVKGGPIARVMVPAELGDPGAMERIPWRTRRAKAGDVYLMVGGEPLVAYDTVYHYDEWPVIAEAGKLVQIVKDTGGARFAVWVTRDTLITVAREDIAVGATPGAVPDAVHNATIRAGGKLVRGPENDGAVEVFLDDPDLAISGWIPAGAVGEIYRYAPAVEYKDNFSLRADTAIHAAPSAGAAVLATAVRPVAAIAHAGAPVGWKEITAHTERAAVRGFVRASAIDPQLVVATGEGHGSGYGFGGAARITVPAGTCLFAQPDADVVGVQLETYDYMVDRQGGPTWWQIKVLNDLVPLTLFVRDNAETGDLSRVQLESCAG